MTFRADFEHREDPLRTALDEFRELGCDAASINRILVRLVDTLRSASLESRDQYKIRHREQWLRNRQEGRRFARRPGPLLMKSRADERTAEHASAFGAQWKSRHRYRQS
jgi:hypothetical protein